MHLGMPALLTFLDRHDQDEALVLATIIGTEGSTYRKRGAMMLISRDGSFEGMISGGCLEGDLLEHAARVFRNGQPVRVTYDMSADEDLVWSLGIGCDGVIHLLLQRLEPDRGLDLLRQVKRSHQQRTPVLMALSLGDGEGVEEGDLALLDRNGVRMGSTGLVEGLEAEAADWPAWRSRVVEHGATKELRVHMPAPVRVLICGAGPDAVPVAEAFRALDWEVAVVDHRPAFARSGRFPAGCSVQRLRPQTLHERLDLDGFDAAVLMTHHLESDAEYLRQLSGRPLAYLGVLGPRARKNRLSEMAGCPSNGLFGPVGLDIGAELPAAIALAIAAEVHAVLNNRDGRPLTEHAHEG